MENKQAEVNSFDWLSVGQFLRHVEVRAVLMEYSLSAVYSFHIPPNKGVRGLIKQKTKLLVLLQENLKRLSRWVKENQKALTPHEVALCRSLYQTTRDLVHVIEGQMQSAKVLVKWEQESLDFKVSKQEVSDELPF